MSGEIELSGLDGANPLGFLAALGTLVTLESAGEAGARLRWRRLQRWVPVLEGLSPTTLHAFAELTARALAGKGTPPQANKKRSEAEKRYDSARRALEDKKREIKKRGLKRKDREAAIESEVKPLERTCDRSRYEWLEVLAEAVPRPELVLGKKIDCSPDEYREHASSFLNQGTRDALGFLASFGTDACLSKRTDAIEPTFFCFVTGSGHQYFLDTVRQLVEKVSRERVEHALFEPWTYRDPKLSMRWDPVEDRRYALMDRDPTASDNKARTVWMANLLAYRSLILFPCAPGRGRLRVAGWTLLDREPAFTWPIWEFPASTDTIRSLVGLTELTAAQPNGSALRARGVTAAFRARRIRVGTGANFKLNFSPSRAVS